MSMTYDTLKAQILSYVNRSDTATINMVPTFIAQAQQVIARELVNLGLEIYVKGNFFDNTPRNVLPRPARWQRSLSFNYGAGDNQNKVTQLFLRTYEYVRNYAPDDSLTGPPLYYADYGYDHILIGPTPDLNYPFEYSYLQLPEPLSDSVGTNWFTNYAPDVLFNTCMVQAIPFLKNDERAPMWISYSQQGIASLKAQDEQRVFDRASNRKSD